MVSPSDQFPTTLSKADAEALDAIMAAWCDCSYTNDCSGASPLQLATDSPEQQERTARVRSILAAMGQCPAEAPADDLAARTMAKIAEARQRQRFADQVQTLATPPVAFRWRELIAVAAVMMIGVGVLWPVLSHSREEARRAACQVNLSTAGMALGRYANDHAGVLPRENVEAGKPWWNVGQQPAPEGPVQSNSANLFLLVRKGYTSFRTLNCPDNPHAPRTLTVDAFDWPNPLARGYSYDNQFRDTPSRIDRTPTLAVMADQNPQFFVDPARPMSLSFRHDLADDSPTRFHNQRGQNILTLSGSVLWSATPFVQSAVGADNIWTAQDVDNSTGRGAPSSPDDSHLVP